MYTFFLSLKQKDGSFLVAHHSEVDVRGIYCLLTVATMLDILTPELVDGTAAFIASCQTYEGGFASASHPAFSFSGSILPPPSSRSPLGEAHGGYTFCALASWVLLQPFLEQTAQPKPEIDLKNLSRWLVNMQGTEIELGGFKGRTNKLVDGCYAWWCGGAFALLEALGLGGIQNANSDEVPLDSGAAAGVWDDVDGALIVLTDTTSLSHASSLSESLFNRNALQEYILYAGQHPAGGLRDKPPKYVAVPLEVHTTANRQYRNADAYHTLYCLSGLSSAQHHIYPSRVRKSQVLEVWEPSGRLLLCF